MVGSNSVWLISDTSTDLSDDFKDAMRARILWGLVRGIRNVFARAYLTAYKRDVWEIATGDIPVLLKFCDGAIEKYGAVHGAASDTARIE